MSQAKKEPKNLAFKFEHMRDAGQDVVQPSAAMVEPKTIRLDDIRIEANFNPRGTYDKEAFTPERLEMLRSSILSRGVLTPVWVRATNEGYVLIAGERRYHAARLAHLTEIPAFVHHVTLDQARDLAIVENEQRESLSILDQTLSGFEMMERHTGLHRADLIKHLNALRKGQVDDTHGLATLLKENFGSSVSTWAQLRSKMFDFTPEESAAVFDNAVDFSVPVVLIKLPVGEKRSELLRRAIEESLNAQQLKGLVDAELGLQQSPVEAEVQSLKKLLPKLAKLEGRKAERARKLLSELQELTQ